MQPPFFVPPIFFHIKSFLLYFPWMVVAGPCFWLQYDPPFIVWKQGPYPSFLIDIKTTKNHNKPYRKSTPGNYILAYISASVKGEISALKGSYINSKQRRRIDRLNSSSIWGEREDHLIHLSPDNKTI